MEGKVEDIIRRVLSSLNLPERCFSYMAGMILDDPPRTSSELHDMLEDFLTDGGVKRDTVKISLELWKNLLDVGLKVSEKVDRIVAEQMKSPVIVGEAGIGNEMITADYVDPFLGIQKAVVNFNSQDKGAKNIKQRRQAEENKSSVSMKGILRSFPPARVYHTKGEAKSKDISIDRFSIMVGGKTLLESACLRIAFPRKYGLVGRNGIGKTSLLAAMAAGEIEKLPKHLHILYVEQEVMGDLKNPLCHVLETDVEREELLKQQQNVHDDVELMMKINERLQLIEAATAESRAAEILSGLGFTQEMMAFPTNKLSGGWRMRLALAKGLFCQPDILLLDEPTNHLDLETVVWLENYIQGYEKTVIIVSHDRAFLNNVATDIIHFYNESLTYYKGNYDDFERVRGEKLLNQKRAHDTQQARIDHVQKFIDRFRYNAKRASLVQSRIKALSKMEIIAEVLEDPTCVFQFPEMEKLNPPLLRIDDGEFGYGDQTILKEINIGIDMETRMAILGRNGCGKTTLLKLLEEHITLKTGQLYKHRRLRIATFTQHHIDQLDLGLSPLEQLAGMYPNTPSEAIRAHLGSFGITGNLALRPICFLSGGQKSRVAFAAVAFKQPHILFLDEPTNHLDIDAVNALIIAIEGFTGGVVIVSHDQHFVSSVCKEIWVIKKNRVRKFKGEFKDYRKVIKGND
jgi:ATP-binding cassette subfamily F protein 3